MGLVSCIWLVVDTNNHQSQGILLDPAATPPSDDGHFYFLASLMGGSAAMVVILSLTSAADLIDSNTVKSITKLQETCRFAPIRNSNSVTMLAQNATPLKREADDSLFRKWHISKRTKFQLNGRKHRLSSMAA